MKDNITAKDLMRPSFVSLAENHTLREALAIVLDNQFSGDADKILIVLDKNGAFSGILTTRNLLSALLPDDMDSEHTNIPSEETLLKAMQSKLEQPVVQALTPNIPLIGPQTRLPALIEIMQDRYLELLPVLDQQRLVGVIYLTDVFRAAAGLALATEEQNE